MWTMFAQRRALLLAFAGGCLSGVTIILSGVGAVHLWRGAEPPSVASRSSRAPASDVAPVLAADTTTESASEPQEATPDELAQAPATHGSRDAASEHAAAEHAAPEHATESGSSVADVLTRLEAAYRQGLIDGARASASHGAIAGEEAHAGATDTAPEVLPAAAPVAPSPHEGPARDTPAKTADSSTSGAAPGATVAPAPATIVAVPAAPVVVALAAPEAAPAAAAGEAPTFVPPEQSGNHEGYASVTQNIHVDNLHQGDVYQQLQVMQYMQLIAGSPYGYYGGYTPPPPAPTHHHYGGSTASTSTPASPFSTPPLPNAAPPFPSFYSSLTNPANPYVVPHRSRALR